MDSYKEKIVGDPTQCNTSFGKWAVRVKREYSSGGAADFRRYFWRKADAIKFIEQHSEEGVTI